MQRLQQIAFVVSLLALSWMGMMATHELGHVLGALVSGGIVERVVVHPLTISRTDVTPNPNPLIVVWLGPIVGCILPLVAAMLVPQRLPFARRTAMFFAGFCLLANGAYIAVGSIDKVGDCGEMLKHGSPLVWSNYDSNWLLAVASDRFRQRVSCTPGVGEASDGLDFPCRNCCRIRDRADCFTDVARRFEKERKERVAGYN